MGQKSIYAAVMDVQTELKKEERVLSMGQRSNSINAALMGVQIKPRMEECA